MDLSALRAEVERNHAVDESAKALITGLAQLLEDAKNDPAEVQALVDLMRGDNDALAAAVAANTPSA